MLYFHKTPALLQWVYPKLTWHGDRSQKRVFLTFDDGPVPEMTPEILKVLKEYQARATFFCVGDNIRKHPEIFTKIIKEGHAAGNHTYHHLDGWKTDLNTYLNDVDACTRQMNLNGYQSNLMRPPYGKISRAQIRALSPKYQIMMWDVLTGDFDQTLNPDQCLNKTLKAVRNGSVIVLHDNPKAAERTFFVLPRLLEFLDKNKMECSLLP